VSFSKKNPLWSNLLIAQVLLVVAKPDVYRSVNSDTYIVFGESSVEDMNAQAQAAQALAAEAETNATEQTETAPAAEEEDDGEVDATGVEEKDIELVVSQANVSRNKAIKALKNNNNDIVNAIMVSDFLFVLLPLGDTAHVLMVFFLNQSGTYYVKIGFMQN
jgi:NACalpha-BTF3-like transcription factor